jgi:hypothetical protein
VCEITGYFCCDNIASTSLTIIYPILMASFDIEADHENSIINKILPMINEEGL